MAKTKSPGYAIYSQQDRRTKNAALKLARHLKKHPKDAQAIEASANVSSQTFRKKPVSKGGWVKEGLRASMVYVPLFNNKGHAIDYNLNNQEKVSRDLAQPIPLTKSNVKAYARILAFTRKNPFQKVATFTTDAEGQIAIAMMHTSKQSNFKAAVV